MAGPMDGRVVVVSGGTQGLGEATARLLIQRGARVDPESEDAVQRKYHGSDDTWLASAEAAQPTGRLVKPEEVARTIGFLLSDESGMLTGTLIDFDQSVQGAGDAPKPTTEETPQ